MAFNLAKDRGDDHVGTAHLLLSLLGQLDGVAAQLVAELGVDPTALAENVDDKLSVVDERTAQRERPTTETPAPRPVAVGQELTIAALGVQRIVRAVASLQPLRSYHYLLALFDDPSSVAAKVLVSLNIDRATVEQRIVEIGTAGTTDEFPHN
jgi:ATP-dependent Clp protease ATP-binding subunit ClpA